MMIRGSLFILATLALTACGVRGQLELPGEKKTAEPASEKTVKPQNNAQQSVQESDEQRELMRDPFFTSTPSGEYDIRGNINP